MDQCVLMSSVAFQQEVCHLMTSLALWHCKDNFPIVCNWAMALGHTCPDLLRRHAFMLNVNAKCGMYNIILDICFIQNNYLYMSEKQNISNNRSAGFSLVTLKPVVADLRGSCRTASLRGWQYVNQPQASKQGIEVNVSNRYLLPKSIAKQNSQIMCLVLYCPHRNDYNLNS